MGFVILGAVVALVIYGLMFAACVADYKNSRDIEDKRWAQRFFWLLVAFPLGLITIPAMGLYGVFVGIRYGYRIAFDKEK